MTARAYLQRVKDPDPISEALARLVVDAFHEGVPKRMDLIARAAREAGVPIDYVLDEVERRVRERQP